MKNKFLENLRKRVIHKLGGMMACEYFNRPLGEIKEYTKFPVRMRTEMHLRPGAVEAEKQIMMRQAAVEIANSLIDAGYYELRSEETPYGTLMELTIEVIPLKSGDAQ